MRKIIFFLITFSCIFWISCEENDLNKRFMPFDEVSASMYFEKNPECSHWYRLLQKAKMTNSYHLSSIPLTCFFVDDKTMEIYMEKKGYKSVEDISEEKAMTLLKYHTLPDVVFPFSSFRDGRLADSTATGDYLACLLLPGEIFINRESKMVRWDIKVTNGLLHQIDHVIDPVEETMYDYLVSNKRYSIFKAAVELTNNQKLFSQLDLESVALKCRRTMFVTADETYQKEGITSAEELAQRYSAGQNNYTDPQNPFNQYVRYHILERDFYTKDWGERMTLKHNNLKIVDDKGISLPTMADNNLILISNLKLDYLVNGVEIDKTNYNIPVRNGVVHEVMKDLPIVQLPPLITLFEVTDLVHFNQISEYRAKSQPKKVLYLEKKKYNPHVAWNSLPETKKDALGYIIFSSDSYNFKDNGFLFGDCLYANLGPKGDLELETPPVAAGKYRIKIMHKVVKQTGGNFQPYVDGVKLGSPVVAYTDGYDSFPWITLGEVDFKTTTRHKIKMTVVKAGELHWDMVVFEPII